MQSVTSLLEQLTPDLLTKKYREENVRNPMFGHCYHSTQALFYLMDTDKLIPMSGIDYRNDTHWWLQDGETIYDVTADQYYSMGQSLHTIQAKEHNGMDGNNDHTKDL
jgi:hypothetical protein